jgi:SHS2 domain-containing protein
LLEEVIYTVEALGKVPVGVVLTEQPDGSVNGFFATVASEHVEEIGAIPKGVSRSDLVFEQCDGEWRCQVLVDV